MWRAFHCVMGVSQFGNFTQYNVSQGCSVVGVWQCGGCFTVWSVHNKRFYSVATMRISGFSQWCGDNVNLRLSTVWSIMCSTMLNWTFSLCGLIVPQCDSQCGHIVNLRLTTLWTTLWNDATTLWKRPNLTLWITLWFTLWFTLKVTMWLSVNECVLSSSEFRHLSLSVNFHQNIYQYR